MSIIGIDASLRSTGITFIDDDENIIDFILIKSKPNSLKANKNKPYPELNEEKLLIYNSNRTVEFIEECMDRKVIEGIVMEGLSFNSKSGSKDLISANWWYSFTEIKKKFPNMPIGRISVNEWRNNLTSIEERREAKKKYEKDALKKMMVEHLPKEVKLRFEEYIKKNNYEKESLYDLTDSFFISVYRLGLE